MTSNKETLADISRKLDGITETLKVILDKLWNDKEEAKTAIQELENHNTSCQLIYIEPFSFKTLIYLWHPNNVLTELL